MKISHRFIGLLAVAALINLFGAASVLSAEELNGKVISADGSPVRDADVYFMPGPDPETVSISPITKTDDSGMFHFNDVSANQRGHLIAIAAGKGIASSVVHSGTANELHLESSTSLTVSFTDAQGKPVTALHVHMRIVFSPPGSFDVIFVPAEVGEPFSFDTDSRGNVTFPNLPRGVKFMLATADNRFAGLTAEQSQIQLSQENHLTAPIKLMPAADITGNVRFADTGKPAAGIRVGAQGTHDGGGDFVTTGPDGSYHLGSLSEDNYIIALDLKDDLAKLWTARAVQSLHVESGKSYDGVDFAMITGAVLTVHVADVDTNKPIAGVPIGVYGPAHPTTGSWVQRAETAADGTCSFHVPGGEQYVYIQSNGVPGYNIAAQKIQTLTVADGQTASVEIKFAKAVPPPMVRGKVVDADGAPVAGATIIMTPGHERTTGYDTAQSAADGTFFLLLPPAIKAFRIHAQKEDLAMRASVAWVVGTDGDLRLKVEKHASASIAGRATDLAGKPLAGAKFQLVEMFGNFGTGRDVGVTDEQGQFRVDELFPEGNYSLSISKSGYASKAAGKLELRSGETTTVIDVALEKFESFIAGTLIDDDGKPVAGGEIDIWGKTSGLLVVRTDHDGKFRVDVASGDTLRIDAFLKDKRRIQKTVKAADANIFLDPTVDDK